MSRISLGIVLFALALTPALGQESASSEAGFVSLFNGNDLSGWSGDERFWRVEDGVIIAEGFQFTHIINDRVMAMGIDEDTANRRAEGIFAFQLHSGPPMQIQLKDIRVRKR